MKYIIFCSIVITFFSLGEVHAELKIWEVMPDPLGSDTGHEYVMLKNTGTGTLILSEYNIDPDALPIYTFGTGSLLPNESISLYFRTDSQTGSGKILVTGAGFGSTNMRNTDGEIILYKKDAAGKSNMVDYLMYGNLVSTKILEAIALGLWNEGLHFIVSEGVAIKKYPDVISGTGTTLPPPPIVVTPIFPVPVDYSENIFSLLLSEIFPNPDGDDTGNEWVEVFNPLDVPIDLQGLQMGIVGNTSGQTFEDALVLEPLSYYVFDHLLFTLPNTNSGIVIKINDAEIDSVSYEKTYAGKSLSRITQEK